MPGYLNPRDDIWRQIEALERRIRTLESAPRASSEYLISELDPTIRNLSSDQQTIITRDVDVLFGRMTVIFGGTIEFDLSSSGGISSIAQGFVDATATNLSTGAAVDAQSAAFTGDLTEVDATAVDLTPRASVSQGMVIETSVRPARYRITIRIRAGTANTVTFSDVWVIIFPQ